MVFCSLSNGTICVYLDCWYLCSIYALFYCYILGLVSVQFDVFYLLSALTKVLFLPSLCSAPINGTPASKISPSTTLSYLQASFASVNLGLTLCDFVNNQSLHVDFCWTCPIRITIKFFSPALHIVEKYPLFTSRKGKKSMRKLIFPLISHEIRVWDNWYSYSYLMKYQYQTRNMDLNMLSYKLWSIIHFLCLPMATLWHNFDRVLLCLLCIMLYTKAYPTRNRGRGISSLPYISPIHPILPGVSNLRKLCALTNYIINAYGPPNQKSSRILCAFSFQHKPCGELVQQGEMVMGSSYQCVRFIAWKVLSECLIL